MVSAQITMSVRIQLPILFIGWLTISGPQMAISAALWWCRTSFFSLILPPKMSFELMFVEVKRKGSYSNGHHESEVVKIGKEMQVAINKLIFQKVENP